MKTDYTVFRVDGSTETKSIDWPEDPGVDRIKELIQPVIGGDIEHVYVLHNGLRADMFVDGAGQLKDLPCNAKATGIYHAFTLKRRPNTDIESLPSIVGTAVLFHRTVWM